VTDSDNPANLRAERAMMKCILLIVILGLLSLTNISEATFDSHTSYPSRAHDFFVPKLLHSHQGDLRMHNQQKGGRSLKPRTTVLGLSACAVSAPNDEEKKIAAVRKIARSVDKVFGATISGFCGPWAIGFVFGFIGAVRGSGVMVAAKTATGTGNTWGTLSAAFCGVEALAREIRGTHDKWNNVIGACSAGVVSNCSRGPQAMATGCLNFAGMSYLLDLFMSKQKDPFEKYVEDPSKLDSSIQGAATRNQPKDIDVASKDAAK
jgi:hypothetical protein